MDVDVNAAFQWQCQPKAENLILTFLQQASQSNPAIATLEKELLEVTSTRLFDWLDHIVIAHSSERLKELEEAGFVAMGAEKNYRVFHHPGAQLPRVVVHDAGSCQEGIAVAVDSIADYLMVRGLDLPIEGSLYSGYRRSNITPGQKITLWAVERRGDLGVMEPITEPADYLKRYLQARERWQTRARSLEDEASAMDNALELAEELVASVGQDRAAWIILEIERCYWQARNTAGQAQKNRQDRLGMGWANHDHHTFRSSRRFFTKLVRLFEILGFQCRERYYTGEEAGWGAQIMENPRCRLVLFLDVDLAPHEIEVNFAHELLPELPQHRTIGLWCALHGDSILAAGMHHLEAQFMFDELTEDLAGRGIKMMNPFSFFPYLKQAFTAGEMWQVAPRRVQKLLKESRISQEHANQFLAQGAVGSHMENLQRREGYKGFNQKNVSIIIKKTDPRTLKQE